MEQINFSDVYARMDTNINFCTSEVRNKIRHFFINNSFHSDRTVEEGLYDDINR